MARAGAGWLVAIIFALLFAAISAAAPYEPNDAIPSAVGPLAFGQTYNAALETATDRDFYYFYVTSKAATPVSLTIRNYGGGPQTTGIDAAVLDSAGTTVDAFAYFLGAGSEATGTMSLEPQKYLVEVKPTLDGAGTTAYSLSAGGGEGAFGPYTQIAARCVKGRAAVNSARTGLQRAQSKLQRSTARLRRSRYSAPVERRAARTGYRKSKSRVGAKRRALRHARQLLRPWCSIPQ